MISRRDLVAGSLAGFAGGAIATLSERVAVAASIPAHSGAELSRLVLTDRVHAGRRLVQLTPAFNANTAPLVVLLHGLGETADPRAGAYAWWERYGLQTCYERLFAQPVAAQEKDG